MMNKVVEANIIRLDRSLSAQHKRDQDHYQRVAASIESYKRRFAGNN